MISAGEVKDHLPKKVNNCISIFYHCVDVFFESDDKVEVEALIIQGAKLATVLSQVKKLEASVLVLSQCKPSPFCW